MKLNKSVFFVLLFFSSFFLSALSLEDVSRGFAKTPVRTGDFVQEKTLNANGRKIKSSGQFVFASKEIIMKTLKPVKSLFHFTETSLIQKAGGKTYELNGSENQTFKGIASALTSIFWADSRSLNENFKITFTQPSDSQWKIELVPIDKTIGSALLKITLWGSLDKNGNSILETMEILDGAENSTKYEYFNQKVLKDFSEDEKDNFINQ